MKRVIFVFLHLLVVCHFCPYDLVHLVGDCHYCPNDMGHLLGDCQVLQRVFGTSHALIKMAVCVKEK